VLVEIDQGLDQASEDKYCWQAVPKSRLLTTEQLCQIWTGLLRTTV